MRARDAARPEESAWTAARPTNNPERSAVAIIHDDPRVASITYIETTRVEGGTAGVVQFAKRAPERAKRKERLAATRVKGAAASRLSISHKTYGGQITLGLGRRESDAKGIAQRLTV